MRMKKLFYRLTPRYYRSSNLEGEGWSSFRWLGTGWDSQIYKDGTRFIQFGKNPVKFVLLTPKGVEAKKFILGARWKTVYYKKGLRVGTTAKPKNFTKLWRMIDGNRHTKRVRTECQPSRLLQSLR